MLLSEFPSEDDESRGEENKSRNSNEGCLLWLNFALFLHSDESAP